MAKTAIHIQIVINDHCPKCSECVLFVMLIEEFFLSFAATEVPSAQIRASTHTQKRTKDFEIKFAINPIQIKLCLLNGIIWNNQPLVFSSFRQMFLHLRINVSWFRSFCFSFNIL